MKPREKPVLGVGDIVTKTLAIFFQRLPIVMLLAAPATVVMVGTLYLMLVEFEQTIIEIIGLPNRYSEAILAFFSFSIALGLGAALASGPLTGAAHAFVKGKKIPIGACFRLMFRKTAVKIAIGTFLAAGVIFVLFLNAVLPGAFTGFFSIIISWAASMYILARWAPALPTVALENTGFASLRRSDWLSAEYRWQGTGTLVLAFIIGTILSGVFTAGMLLAGAYIIYEVFDVRLANTVEEVLIFLDATVGLSIAVAILTLAVAVLRLRLIEIKEPPDLEDMIEVFE